MLRTRQFITPKLIRPSAAKIYYTQNRFCKSTKHKPNIYTEQIQPKYVHINEECNGQQSHKFLNFMLDLDEGYCTMRVVIFGIIAGIVVPIIYILKEEDSIDAYKITKISFFATILGFTAGYVFPIALIPAGLTAVFCFLTPHRVKLIKEKFEI